jgi:hypothetical protein
MPNDWYLPPCPWCRWMAVNAGLAYATNLLNFLVTKWTSALTLQVGKSHSSNGCLLCALDNCSG